MDWGFEVVFFGVFNFDSAGFVLIIIRVADVDTIFDGTVGIGVLAGDVVGLFGNKSDPRRGDFVKLGDAGD